MSWIGQTHGLWQVAEAEADADVAAARMGQQNNALAQWKAHADKLQKALDELKVSMVSMSGAEAGQAALKREALNEIQKLDPSNKLLDPKYREKLYNDVKAKTEKDLQKKS